ncbi:MAG: 1-pyrroline-5-carboxylate dehydrogenase, partial [Myxococcaceae bacterium]|nr:1-pyrroline-5-carboxylate dehydrogenase [Myxococcaceae bacterium]
MLTANVRVPPPKNEPVLSYAPNTPERAQVKDALAMMEGERIEIPVLIGGKRILTGHTDTARMPHRHQH